ncbi:MAG: undecaprenyl/decaprenyl-phosphate alpha-N-acetylglucosaminyl 1-phosphate transferase [Patescibacteria group bacterium]|nr:undecaprenyl/decaprenyl-phosphate alpha-N-acetylglucosaminyl 1-phosphate transferase [Patescibacteria group bacterium]
MNQEFFWAFLSAGILSAASVPLVRRLAWRVGAVDYPDAQRKIQDRPVPALGGLAVFFGVSATLLLWMVFSPGTFGPHIKFEYLWGLLLGGAILMVGGYLDDRYKLPPRLSFVAPVLAVLVVILSGVQLSYINHPFGGAILLDTVKVSGYPVAGGLFVFIWILGMIYTTKFLDGMDGLASGTVGIGAVVLFFLSQVPVVNQMDTALLCIIFAGALFGFLPWNFHPAEIFLGEGGSTYAGFILGTLAVISGGKIATALLIMGIPILDVAWVILRRLATHFSPFVADRKHLHFRILDLGLSQRQTVLFLYFISAAFGVSGLFLQSVGKLVALFILLSTMLVLGSFLVIAYNRKGQKEAGNRDTKNS